jgi:glycosyltransferase involved in cell wall biosynthesis
MSLKILIVAQNATSRFGGEAFLPLKYFQILKKRGHVVNLVVHGRNREDLTEHFSADMASIHFIEDSWLHRQIWRISKAFPRSVSDVLVGNALSLVDDIGQARLIRQLIRQKQVDIIHQPIPVSPKAPSSIHGFGVPVVMGPMNGGMTYPPGYQDHQSRAERHLVAAARQVAVVLNWLIPGKRRAATLVVANARTRDALPVSGHPRVVELVENGVDLSVWRPAPDKPARDRNGPFEIAFAGRLVAWKAMDITLEALRLARADGIDARLSILGDGPERARLQAQAQAAGLSDSIRFLGYLPQQACARQMQQADALILNSVHECGGAVVLEAMSLGLPVIAADWGGPADYLDATCGVLVSPIPRETFARRLANAMVQLAQDPALCQRMGQSAAARIRSEFDWERKVDKMLTVYQAALTPAR